MIKENVLKCDNCSGCMSCKIVCPINCIQAEYDSEGFLYPVIDNEKCINCKKCISMCPEMKKSEEEFSYEFAYAAAARDDIRLRSSSGGMFTLLAQYILRSGGVVCGAAYIGNNVRHIVIEDEKSIDLLRGSKYVQSEIFDIYIDILRYLKNGRNVLFTGTACQCAAIKDYFSEYDEQLYIVDILCMVVSSPKMFETYVKEELGKDCTRINFRDKGKEGWNQNLYLSYFDGNNKKHYINNKKSSYYSAFLNAYALRKSCYNCRYIGKKHTSDLTIGDFWGCQNIDTSLDDGKGTSLVLVSTDKGKNLLNGIESELLFLKKEPIQSVLKFNPILLKSSSEKGRRREFFNLDPSMSLKNKVEYMNSNAADCGIINYWYCNDNGAILTAYALQQSLLKMGYSSRLINDSGSDIEKGISEEFSKKYLYVTSHITTNEDYKKLNDSFEHFIVGSDQVFRAEWVSDRWFLDFVDDEKNKIAVSSSFGNNELNVTRERRLKIQYLLSRFNSISIREIRGTALAHKLSGKKTFNIIDPVFWLKKEDYILKLNLETDLNEHKYIFVYIRDIDTEKKDLCERIAKELDCRLFFVMKDTPVELFVEKLANSEMVITDSYHGLCFSIIFNKNYRCIINKRRGLDRFNSLIQVLQLNTDCFIKESSDLQEKEAGDLLDKNDWDIINNNIEEQRKFAITWIKDAIKNKRKVRKINRRIKWVNYCLYIIISGLRTYFKCRFFYFKYIIFKIDYSKRIVLFGAGNFGKKAIQRYGDNIAFFVDNSPKNWLENYPVFSFKLAKKLMNHDTKIIITTSIFYQSEIKEQLEKEGYKNISFYQE